MNKWGHSKQKGYVLFTVVVMLVVVAVTALLVSYDSSLKASMPAGEAEASRADYVAEAAMQHALWQSANNACMGGAAIPITALGSDSYTAAITGAAAGTAYTLAADQDAWIRSDDVTKINGGAPDQHIRFESGNVEQALTRFDLSSLPADAQINSATAWFYVTPSGPGGGAHPEGPITVHRVTADWTEDSVTGATWENMNGNFESSRLATIPAQPDDGIWISFNLTGQVQAWANGQPNYGILMASTAEGVHARYASIDGVVGERPYLDVVVGSGTASPVNIQATGTLANGNTRSLTRLANPALQPSSTYTFQPDATDGIDAYIWEAQKTTNKGTDDETWVSRTSNNASLSLLKFNMGAIPARSKILSATLSLHNRSGNNSDVPVTAHRITNPWNEDFVTWNNRDSGTPWDTAGGDVDPTVIASTNVGPTRYVRYEWDIASLVQGWTDGAYENHGVALATAMASSVGERFDTSDHADPLRRPSLTVTYSCECGNACMVPQGVGTIAMVVINPTTLVPADAYKKALFESWGYTVDVIGESENQASYDAVAATSNVFFISETVNSNQVGNNLVNVPLGVVSQDGSYNSDLGLAGSSSWPVSRAINVTDTSHYITAIFPAGPLDIYSGAMEQLTISGGAAAGLQTLADTSGAGSLVALDKNAALLGGGSAAGRRVMLPLGREGRVNWDYLNNNGLLIVQRALAWGVNADATVGAAGRLLLVVGNAGSPASKDTDRQALFESWGYAVTLIDDGADQLKFDTESAANDVIYVSGTIIDLQLADKLTGSTTPVVNEDWDKLDNFGFADTGYNIIYDQLAVTDPLHYITEPFGGAAVIIATTGITMTTAYGTVAPDLQFVGEVVGNLPGLATLETGAQRWDATPAPGRRVQVPFQNAEISQLTADGVTLMKRSIEWGASAGSGGCGTTIPLWMLVADASNPTAEETARETLFESWCYSVTLSTASDPQEVYDKYAAEFDVVYAPSSVPWADISSKLKYQPVGVVSEVATLSAYLGFTSGTSGYTGTVTELTDNSHYITSGLPLGNLALTTTSTSLRHFTNTMGPGFKTLSVRPTQTNPMIMTLETGDELLWGGQAPDRRVMLPWGGSSTFDVNNLTADGLTILQRSLEWAVGAGAASPGYNVLLIVGNDTTLASKDVGYKALMESWGHTVAVLDDGASQTDYDTAMAAADVIYASGSALGASMLDKATYTTKGLVNEVNGKIDNFGFSSSTSATTNFDAFSTTNAAHYITEPFAGTAVTVFTSFLTNPIPGGTLAPDLQNVGEVSGTPSLVTLDAGATGWNGNPVPARRAHLPFASAETTDMTADGKTILQRALEWAAGAGGGGGGGPPGYFDEFNNRDCSAADYAGTDGSLDWSPWSWTETSESNGSCSGLIQIADDPAVADPGSFRLMLDERNRRVDRLMDLSAFTDATLSFDYRLYNYPTSADSFVVIVSGDGMNWQKLAAFTGIVSHSDYQAVSYDITPFIGTNTGIGFMTEGINTIQTAYIDNVRVFEGGGGGGGGGGAGTYRDEFNAQVYSGSEGTLTWATDWLEIGESDGPTKGKVSVLNDISNFQLQLKDKNRGVEREADLSGHASATMTFDYRRESLDGATDYMTVEVSSNGGSTWTEIDRLVGPATDGSYQGASYDISAHIAANTRIRLLTSGSNGKNDFFYIDNVEIN